MRMCRYHVNGRYRAIMYAEMSLLRYHVRLVLSFAIMWILKIALPPIQPRL